MRMIVVEDEQRSREGLCRLLSALPGNHQLVGQASNGVAALDMILQLKPDVVFTDIGFQLFILFTDLGQLTLQSLDFLVFIYI